MRAWPALILAPALTLTGHAAWAQSTPENASEAHPAWTYSVSNKCPDLHAADDGPAAVVVFFVNDFGAPSQISLQTSSGTPALDEAALKCVQRLKFQPRTRLGDGAPIGSWQKIAWRWQRAATGAAMPQPPLRPRPPSLPRPVRRICGCARMMPGASPRRPPSCTPPEMRTSMLPP